MSQTTTSPKIALVLGATGAVGKAVVKDLLVNEHYTKVVAAGRRHVQLDDSIPQDKLVQETIDFENLDESRGAFKDVDDVYCCLGTTRKDAGSAEAFRKIDQEYVIESAKMIAQENPATEGVKSKVHFLYCSSVGANANSYFLYPQSKGQTEERLQQIGFSKVSIFQPGGLVVEEARPRFRPAESFIGLIDRVSTALRLNMTIPVGGAARAMRKAATDTPAFIQPKTHQESGSQVIYYSNRDMLVMNQQ
ncbi:hypothetical protein DM01DRAFT_1306879 [Hesseltinella vesiculosa]|uniref:NAD(P)-binding domain-containing protein n=1 Tax=Hesseltinella vesiculosa TaxID=101127 RepID=A0A1X2GFA0_9FUNG|nr:hypothetical protein DM01DRAFT_1306879 [Hesseltinella vesiculosa]